jgi:CheY-like chemotaxis protein
VYGIVKQAGGHVDVYSEVDRGTVFKVYLPWAGDEASHTESAGAVPTYPVGSEHVLVVEDDAAVRDIIVHVLSTHGYQVHAVSSGDAALTHVESGAPVDLVVSDVMMPGMSGPAMIEAIMPRRPHVRVLFLSGYTEEASALTGLRPAHVAFLQKPFSFSALLTKTREVLQGLPLP